MEKPKTPLNEGHRQASLDSHKILDTLPEKSFDELTLIAAQICGTPIALVSLVDKNRLWFKSKFGLAENEIHRDVSFCGHAINNPAEIYIIEDTKADPRFSDNPMVDGQLEIGFYAGVPLLDSSNMAIGTLCVIDHKPRVLSKNQLSALEALAGQVLEKIEDTKFNHRLISDKKRINEAFNASESRYFNLYHNAPDMMLSVDPYTKQILTCNDTLCRRLGYNHQEVIGMEVFQLFDANSYDDAMKVLSEFLEFGSVSNKRLVLSTKENAQINVAINIEAVRGVDGKILFSNSILRDIEDLIETEKKLLEVSTNFEIELKKTKSFLEKVTSIAPSIIYVFDQVEMKNDYTNREIGKVLGYSSDEITEMKDQLMPILCHKEDLESVFAHMGEIKNLDDNETISIEYRMKHKNGNYVHLLSEDAVFERNDKGHVTKHLGVATDITTLKKGHLKLKQQAVLLKKQNEDLKQFAYVATHDMKGPMVTLLGHFNFLKTQFPQQSEAVKESIEYIDEEIKNFMNTISGLNSAIEVREQVFDNDSIAFDLVLEEVLASFTKRIKKRNVKVNLNLGRKVNVWGNYVYIKSILTNLLSNSLKYRSKSRTAVVDISTAIKGNYLIVKIKDNGIGINLELQKDKVFKMFNRFHTNFEGTGMGLYMVKSMTEKMGGSVSIKSKVDSGTELTIKLKKCDG